MTVKKPKKGRPPKFQVGDHVRANSQAPGEYRERVGMITELGPGASDYRVEFDDGHQPTTGYLMFSWLNAEK
jgi:hypothetical protein